MTKRKNKNNKRNKTAKSGGSVASLAKAFAKQVLKSGGAALGGALGGPAGAAMGSKAGAFISRITGMGDYEVKQNSLMGGGKISFSDGTRKTPFAHTDYIGEITASDVFKIQSFSINPGLPANFPRAAGLARNFQQYRLKGCVFYFKSTSAEWSGTGQALGSIVMATQYDVTRPNFTSKIEMNNYMFSTSGKPADDLVHPIECDPSETPVDKLYLRTGRLDADQDPKFYDWGTFQIAVVGCPSAVVGEVLGELHVAYDLEFYKPVVPPGGSLPGQYYSIVNANVTLNDPFGPLQTVPYGDLDLDIRALGAGYDTIYFPPHLTGGRFLIDIIFRDTGAVVWTTPTSAVLTNLSYVALMPTGNAGGRAGVSEITTSGVTTTVANWSAVVDINGFSAAGSQIRFTWGVIPMAGGSGDVIINVVAIPDVFTY